MMLFDPSTFGTPLAMLQMPPDTIKDIHLKLLQSSQNNTTLLQYTQDCKTMDDLAPLVSAQDHGYAKESYLDVGYICRKCQMVYPGRDACAAHQQAICYADPSKPGEKAKPPPLAIIKFEQIQFECSLCEVKVSTIQEYKEHCETPLHCAALAKRSMGGFIKAKYSDEEDEPSEDETST